MSVKTFNNGSQITTNGTYVINQKDSRFNCLILSGGFGGGSVEVDFSFDGVNWGKYGAYTAPVCLIFGSGAYPHWVQLVVTGMTAGTLLGQVN